MFATQSLHQGYQGYQWFKKTLMLGEQCLQVVLSTDEQDFTDV